MYSPSITNDLAEEIYEVLEDQLRNEPDSMTQSDLQGRITAIVWKILDTGAELERQKL